MIIETPAVGLSGRYRMVVSSDAEMKNIKQEVEFDNLITNTGLNRLGIRNPFESSLLDFHRICGRFVVGTGSKIPEFTDTSLSSPVRFATIDPILDSVSSNYERGYAEIVMRHQFGQGEAQGNLSEIGIQHGSLSGPLWSRALLQDGLGNPTTITVRDTDFLTCFYTLRTTIPKEDHTFNITVDYGSDGLVPTTVTIRPLATNTVTSYGMSWYFRSTYGRHPSSYCYGHVGDLAPPTSDHVTGYIGQSGYPTFTEYVENSHKQFCNYSLTLTEMNSQSIRTISYASLLGAWQAQFDPPLKKDNTQNMDLTFGVSWARA